MDQSEVLIKVLCEEALSAEETQAHTENLEADPDLERSLAGWDRFRACIRDRIPGPRDFVLYSLGFGGHAEDLSEEEAAEVNEKRGTLDSVIESSPGFSEVAAQIKRDRQDFLTCWEMEDSRPKARVLSLRTFRMAAAIAVLAVSVITILLLMDQGDVALHVATAEPGEYERVLLPDGSIAHLNGPATLRFDEQNFLRSVELMGIAFFDIAHQPDQFSVQTKEAITKVLGTRFGVRSINGFTEVVLETGQVEVASKGDSSHSVLLVPGQMTSVARGDAAPTSPVEVDIGDQLGWTGFIFLRDTSLRRVAVILSLSRKIRVDVDPSLMNERVTGTFAPDVTVEEILDALALALNAKVLIEGDTYRIIP